MNPIWIELYANWWRACCDMMFLAGYRPQAQLKALSEMTSSFLQQSAVKPNEPAANDK